jgi:hypothetical protein
MADALLTVLAARNVMPSAAERARILTERDFTRIERWLRHALTCSRVEDVLSV